jgi:hypothetical protein
MTTQERNTVIFLAVAALLLGGGAMLAPKPEPKPKPKPA